MNVDRLKIWEAALLDAEEKGRVFDFYSWKKPNKASPCGFTACLAGDLAAYPPAQDLGLGFNHHHDITMEGCQYPGESVCAFLETEPPGDEDWVLNTILPSRARTVYGKPPARVTRLDGLARIRKKIRELETARVD